MNQQTKNRGPQSPTKRSEFDKDQPAEPAGGQNPTSDDKDEVPPRFDEGGRKPAPIERTSEDGVRSAEPGDSASLGKGHKSKQLNTEATMPPGEHQPKRNTM